MDFFDTYATLEDTNIDNDEEQLEIYEYAEPIVDQPIDEAIPVDDEFADFVEAEPDEFQVGYSQLQHISYGAVGSSTVGAKNTRLERIVHMQTVSKESQYTGRLAAELSEHFDSSKINHYVEVTKQLPRFWLKNIPTLVVTYRMIETLNGKNPTAAVLAKYASPSIGPEDIYRYYRLIKENNNI